MNTRNIDRQIRILLLIGLMITTCAPTGVETPDQPPAEESSPSAESEPANTPNPATSTPGPRSCEEVEGPCMALTYNCDTCIYEGPSELEPGPITFLYINNCEGYLSSVNLVRHRHDEPMQDMIDYLGEEPSSKHAPPWVTQLNIWHLTRYGEVHAWEGVLEPGIHTMVCACGQLGIWYGGGFVVQE